MDLFSESVVTIINNWVHPIALISGLFFPLIRIVCRYFYQLVPYHKGCNFLSDLSNGVAFPYFCMMVLAPFGEGFIINPYIIALAGIYGCHTITNDLFGKTR